MTAFNVVQFRVKPAGSKSFSMRTNAFTPIGPA